MNKHIHQIIMGDITEDVIDFADITNQINRREMNRTYEFNLMLVGLTGVGKSTLVKSLFQDMIKPEETMGEAQLNEYSDLLEENGVKLKLRCIETSNFDSHDSEVYANYIDEKLADYFVAQRRQSSWNIQDTRVHCCLYMIQPYGKMRLRDEDLDAMRALHEKVNLIPIISKADTFNSIQLAKFKENILADLKMHGIKYFKFTHNDKEDEERYKAVHQEAERFPFAVVAADEPTIIDRRLRWIRETISGHIDIYDKRYDFDALAKLLIRHCMLNLIDSTHVKHYAKYKAELLDEAKQSGGKNLESLGLEPHEIGRIEYDSNLNVKGDEARKSLQQMRADMGKELQDLRDKLQAARLGISHRSERSKAGDTPTRETHRERPAILREKPEYLKNLHKREA